jgi:hypothetical protein
MPLPLSVSEFIRSMRHAPGISCLAIAILLLAPGALQAYSPDGASPDVPHEVVMPRPGEAGPDVFWPVPGFPTSPPDNPQVGDSWLWWLWVFQPMPPHFEQAMCTVRGVSPRGYVVVRDTDWLVHMDQADVDVILERWENSSVGPYPTTGIYDLDSLAFGEPPDELDMDPRIYLMWFEFGVAADGFFFSFDEFPEGTYPEYHSNECEVLYLNPTSSGGPSGNYMLAVTAHEFEHMIHWNHDSDEASWVDEGMAELAMWFYGAPDNISSFNSNPDNSLIVWNGDWADYIKTYLWSLYFYEQYGGQPSVYAVVQEPANSIQGYENVLDNLGYSQNFEDVFADWTVANYLDDTTIEDGRFGYAGDDLPVFALSGTYSTYPVTNVSKTVNHWAADYYRFTGLGSYGNILLSFDGDDTNNFKVWGLAIHADGTTQVHYMPIDDATQTGALWLSGLTDPADQVVLVVGGASSTGGTGYYFSASASAGVESDPGAPPAAIALGVSPNPFMSSVSLQLQWSGESAAGGPTVEIYDLQGRLVTSLSVEAGAGNQADLVWDGTDAEGLDSPSGVYLARAIYGLDVSTSRLVRVR